MRSWSRAWAPALVWAVVLFWLSSRPTLPTDLEGGLDKVAHFGAFTVLGLLLSRGAIARCRPIALPVLLGLAYAASDEIHQYFVPGRYPDAADWVADAIGVLVGCVFFYRLRAAGLGTTPSSRRVSTDSSHS